MTNRDIVDLAIIVNLLCIGVIGLRELCYWALETFGH